MTLTAGKYTSLRRLADANGRFKMVAIDQRPPLFELVTDKTGASPAAYEHVAAIKSLVTETLSPHGSAMLLDPIWGYSSCIGHVGAARGILLTDEDHAFTQTPGGRLSREIPHWSVAKIKRLGADGVKLLAWYRPDAHETVRRHQQALVEKVGRDCVEHDLTFLLELLVYAFPGEDGQTGDYVEQAAKRPEQVLESVRHFTDPRFNVDIFKLESPVAAAAVPEPGSPASSECQQWFDELGRIATRPWVMLSAGADMVTFRRVLQYAYRAGASGYLAGRAIWQPAVRLFPDTDAIRNRLMTEAVPYMQSLNLLTDEQASAWFDHRCFGGQQPLIAAAGPEFHRLYGAP
ncbi:MAG: tagatose 1,6-diphosphate aldolase [Burkholderiaceae bacterium]